MQEKVELANTTDYKYFLYNSQGVVGFVQNGTTYMYRKNFFGDVTAIYRGTTKVAEYAYDAWGNCTIVSDTNGIGTANPFRYRSYFWDNDLQLYYLMNRYYDPQVGRFINADQISYLTPHVINGLNCYSYCYSDPINYIDPLGHIAITAAVSVRYALMAFLTLMLIATVIYIESETHIIENTFESLKNAIVDLFENIGDCINSTIIDDNDIVNVAPIDLENATSVDNILYIKGKKVAPRNKSNSKKKAKEKAFLKGGKKPPIHHPNGKHGPHFHPNDPRFKHWHYYYSWLQLLRNFDE